MGGRRNGKAKTFGELLHRGAILPDNYEPKPAVPTFFEVHRTIHLAGLASLAQNIGGQWVVMHGEYSLYPVSFKTKREAIEAADCWAQATKDRWQSKQSVED